MDSHRKQKLIVMINSKIGWERKNQRKKFKSLLILNVFLFYCYSVFKLLI